MHDSNAGSSGKRYSVAIVFLILAFSLTPAERTSVLASPAACAMLAWFHWSKSWSALVPSVVR